MTVARYDVEVPNRIPPGPFCPRLLCGAGLTFYTALHVLNCVYHAYSFVQRECGRMVGADQLLSAVVSGWETDHILFPNRRTLENPENECGWNEGCVVIAR